ncbi:MAG: hypothetical protein Kow00121_32370 [Elainellaceae cyanobacterium]
MKLDPVKTLSIFQRQAEPKVYPAGQAIFNKGEPADYMYGILEGEVEISVNGKTVETLSTGEVFGTGALIEIKDRAYTAIAKTDCKLAFLDRARFMFAIQETPIFALEVMRNYSDRLLRIEHMI